VHRNTKRHQPEQLEQTELMTLMHALSARYPRFGYRQIWALLAAEGYYVGGTG
jgi:hypothetical protein